MHETTIRLPAKLNANRAADDVSARMLLGDVDNHVPKGHRPLLENDAGVAGLSRKE